MKEKKEAKKVAVIKVASVLLLAVVANKRKETESFW